MRLRLPSGIFTIDLARPKFGFILGTGFCESKLHF
jgi:hypothetical protein